MRTRLKLPLRVRGGGIGKSSAAESGWRINGNPPQPAAFSRRDSSAPIPSNPTVEDLAPRSEEKAATVDSTDAASAFLSRGSRNRFISQVYTILSCQLLFTIAAIFGLHSSPGVLRFIATASRGWVPMLSILVSSVAFGIAASNQEARRRSPTKWQLLAVFTGGQALITGFITCFYPMRTVVSAMGATALATGGVSLYTIANKDSKRDLSQWGASLASFSLVFLVISIIRLLEIVGVLPRGFLPISEAAFCLGGATLFSGYLAHHTRMIVAGKHTKYRLHERDYVFGAMLLYDDIVTIFIYILRILGEKNRD